MKITKKRAKAALKDLEEAWDVVFKGRKLKRSSTTWERQRKKVSEKIRNLEPFVKEAILPIRVAKPRGRPKMLRLMQRTMIFLFVILVGKSNRYSEALLEFFQPFFGLKVNYKYIERLYSDELVRVTVFFSLFIALEDSRITLISGSFSSCFSGKITILQYSLDIVHINFLVSLVTYSD